MEWKEVKMKDFCYNVADGTHDSPKRQDEGRYLITSKHIKGSSIDYENAYKISEEDYQKIIKRSRVDRWDVIISMIGAYCGFCYLEDSEVTEYAVKNVGLLKVGKKYESQWLYYFLNSPEGKAKLFSCRAGSTQPYISLGTLRELSIKVPKEHHDLVSIVSILSSLDRKIELNNKINAQLEEMAQTLFKHWFVDFGPFKDGKFVESELGMIPEGWRVLRADEVYEINIGKTPPRKEQQWFSEDENDNIWVSISDMGSCGMFISRSSEYLTDDAIKKHNVVLVNKNTILLSFKLTVGRVAISDECLTTNEAIARFILPDMSHLEFLYLYLKRFDYNKLGSTSSIATAVNSKTIKSMKVLRPSDEVLATFSKSINPLFERVRFLLKENRKLASLRDTLLPKLMSGEINLEDYGGE